MPTPTAIPIQHAQCANRLREGRQREDLTMDELAERSGVGKPTIVRIELRNHWPERQTMDALAAALRVDVGWLFYVVDSRLKKGG